MEKESTPTNFIRSIIEDDLRENRLGRAVRTRFPPEPNGHLHIGHAKSICLNFGTALDFGGTCNLRFDDTNPEKESSEFQEAIEEDVRWLGFDWDDRLYHASDYFRQLHDYAVELIELGKAYVDSMSAAEMREYRGTLTERGRESRYRNRSIEENLDLFRRMEAGDFDDGEHVLRAKIDMASPNINMRDPTLYRIRRTAHHRTGSRWNIYPMYDYTHCISDAIEGITHSLCTLEFEDHRPLYDWVLDQLPIACHPRQIEFARLEVNYTITSKRKLSLLVNEGHVAGWDDPRLPTLKGMRRRGYPSAAIRDFCERVGVTKKRTTIDIGALENCVREHLDGCAPRAMAVVNPLKLIIENYTNAETDELDAPNHPKDDSFGVRKIKFTRELYIERDDFMEDPPRKFFRLAPGREVRLRYAYLVTCQRVLRDPESGEVTAVYCTYDPESRGGSAPDGRKVKGTIHWVSAEHARRAEIRLYDRLFRTPNPAGEEDFRAHLNPDSIVLVKNALVEPCLTQAQPGAYYQFERLGYFCADEVDHGAASPVFNRAVTLRDTWAKRNR
ncbi:MAG: glutamine--tRNA ligase/YqeY domain fusion protein [Gammaproteobacteria bacterium]|nr:glutamine--tRNA ligase/YqeY domain fusion protein [Gammaproteobacteria bacterium]